MDYEDSDQYDMSVCLRHLCDGLITFELTIKRFSLADFESLYQTIPKCKMRIFFKCSAKYPNTVRSFLTIETKIDL